MEFRDCILLVSFLLTVFFRFVFADDILSVQVFFRHGTRTPVLIDPNTQHLWDQIGYSHEGMLTKLGEIQMRELGKALHQRYVIDEKFLSETPNTNVIYARSTDVDRTLLSAQNVIDGLYPQNFFPVHTVNLDDDKLLYHWCPSYATQNVKNMEIFDDELISEYSEFLENLYNLTGWRSAGVNMSPNELIFYTADNMVCQESLELEVNEYIAENRDLLLALQTLRFERQYSLMEPNDPRGPNGAFMGRTISQNIKAPTHQLYLYAAHETTLISLYNSLGILFNNQNFLNPPAGSTLIIEHRKRSVDGSEYIMGLYGEISALVELDSKYNIQELSTYHFSSTPLECETFTQDCEKDCHNLNTACELDHFLTFVEERNPEFDIGCCFVNEAFFEIGCGDFLNPDVNNIGACMHFRRLCPRQSCGNSQILDYSSLLCVECR